VAADAEPFRRADARPQAEARSDGVGRACPRGAEEARHVAGQMGDPVAREMMLRNAVDYQRLADHAERRAAKS
jgi:hypothetical protein